MTAIIKTCLKAFLVSALVLVAATAWSQPNQIIMDPLCTADFCPGCPQPLDMAYADQQCRKCVNSNLTKISFCAKKQKQVMDNGFVGVWRTTAGLTMAVKQNSQVFWGELAYVPENLRQYYPDLGVDVMRARQTHKSMFKGSLLAPSGRWVDATFTVNAEQMTSNHPGGKAVSWRKTIRVHTPNPGSMGRDGLGQPG